MLTIIGRGSYGKVFLARHLQTGKVLAVKVQNKAKLGAQERLIHAQNEQEVLVTDNM